MDQVYSDRFRGFVDQWNPADGRDALEFLR
jgi:hypothetical protein